MRKRQHRHSNDNDQTLPLQLTCLLFSTLSIKIYSPLYIPTWTSSVSRECMPHRKYNASTRTLHLSSIVDHKHRRVLTSVQEEGRVEKRRSRRCAPRHHQTRYHVYTLTTREWNLNNFPSIVDSRHVRPNNIDSRLKLNKRGGPLLRQSQFDRWLCATTPGLRSTIKTVRAERSSYSI